MKHIEFNNKSAQKLYENYINSLKRFTSVLSEEDANDLIMEFNSHIYEGLQNSESEDETENIISILEKLGDPAETLKPLIAGKKLRQATKTFNPKHIGQAIALNVKNSFVFGVFGLLYFCLFVFLLLIPAKLIWPSRTGLFLMDGEFKIFGIITATNDYTEILGFWLIPIVLAVSAIIYLFITLLMRLWRKT